MNDVEERLRDLIRRQEEKAYDNLPWYKKQIKAEDFSIYKSRNGRLYVQHKDWKDCVFVGPCQSKEECDKIIESYFIHDKNDISTALAMAKNLHSVMIRDKSQIEKL